MNTLYQVAREAHDRLAHFAQPDDPPVIHKLDGPVTESEITEISFRLNLLAFRAIVVATRLTRAERVTEHDRARAAKLRENASAAENAALKLREMFEKGCE